MTSPLLLATPDSCPDPESALITSWALRIATVTRILPAEAQNLLAIVVNTLGLDLAKRYVEQVEERAISNSADLAAATARLIAAYCASYSPVPDNDVA